MRSFPAFLLLAVVCTAGASPPAERALSLQRSQFSTDLYESTGKLVQALVADLQKAALNAKDAFTTFNKGLLEQGNKIREKIKADIAKLRENVSGAINTLQEKITNSGSGVESCLNGLRDKAEAILSEAQEQTLSCSDEKIEETAALIKGLGTIGANGQALAVSTSENMEGCTKNNENILATGMCLGSVLFKSEVKTAQFLMESGLAIGKANVKMATLPASLEVCAGSSLVSAGAATGRILMELGSCSTNSIMATFTGSSATSIVEIPTTKPESVLPLNFF